MSVFDTVRVVVYRFHEKGLEIFLVNSGLEEENWRIPFTNIAKYTDAGVEVGYRFISLETDVQPDGSSSLTCAIEGDWHDIPSIRKLIKEDLKLVSSKIDMMDKIALEKGTFFAIKEAFKKVMPNEYKVLHELKDILMHRNIVKNM
ncbi:MAG TPA: hypothetical protein VFG10_21040 [Saprospiraceae bacterium]|nr:hypothetical protein [Saprospiraceae bacterium]